METRPAAEPQGASDGDLVRQARSGVTRAFETLVRRYQGLAVARAYAVVRDRGEAEDVAQEAFIRAFRCLGQLREPEAFVPWLLQTVVNVARRAATRLARRPGPLLDGDGGRDPSPNMEVLDAIGALPAGYQQVLHLHYAQGCSCQEIARLTGLQVSSVTSRLTRARQMLRRLLSEDRSKP